MSKRPLQIADIFEAVADAVPDRTALITNNEQRTYAELDERATRLANHLASKGIVAGDHVAVHAMNCVEWAEAFYACFKLRAVPININFRYVEKELRHLYANSEAVAVIVAPEFVANVEAVGDVLPDLRYMLVLGEPYEAALSEASPERDFEERSEDDHYIIYTGGTTGLPKGVVWRHGDIIPGALNSYRYGAPIESVEQIAEEAAAKDAPMRLQMMGPMMHGGSQWAMANTLVAGGTAMLYTEPVYDAAKVLQMAADNKVASLNVIGDAMARPLADHLAGPESPEYDLSNLMAISNGGAPISHAVREQLQQVMPNVILIDAYGSSETGTIGIEQGAQKHAAPKFHVGPETAVLGLDGKLCGPGETGMLARSGHIPLRYHGDPEKTAETFREIEGKRWALSGDAAEVGEDGIITILGRGSTSINTGGEKVHPEEVEAALMEHEDVLDAAVVGVPSDVWGEQVTALVQLRGDRPESADALKQHCKGLVAGYKVPKQIIFVATVPRTAVGKVDYRSVKTEALKA